MRKLYCSFLFFLLLVSASAITAVPCHSLGAHWPSDSIFNHDSLSGARRSGHFMIAVGELSNLSERCGRDCIRLFDTADVYQNLLFHRYLFFPTIEISYAWGNAINTLGIGYLKSIRKPGTYFADIEMRSDTAMELSGYYKFSLPVFSKRFVDNKERKLFPYAGFQLFSNYRERKYHHYSYYANPGSSTVEVTYSNHNFAGMVQFSPGIQTKSKGIYFDIGINISLMVYAKGSYTFHHYSRRAPLHPLGPENIDCVSTVPYAYLYLIGKQMKQDSYFHSFHFKVGWKF